MIKSIVPKTLKQWIDNEEVVLVDVREPMEFQSCHIAGAKLIPLGTVSAEKLPVTNKKIVIYCQKGLRGNSACKKLEHVDFSEIYNLEGGLNAWLQEDFPAAKSETKIISLDRQVQITIGTFVLMGSIASILVNPSLIVLPIFFGAGLVFAGLTDTCGLAILMAKMPWNQKV